MKIFCDIGNTQTKIAMLNKEIKFKIIPTKNFIEFYSKHIHSHFYISCVVNEIEKFLLNKSNIKIVTYKDFKKYIDIKYNTKNLGTDRILSSFAAKKFFNNNFAIINCGSTIVIDYVDKNGVYVGGEIFPGLNTLAKFLVFSTSKLPLIKFRKKFCLTSLIGRDTEECINKGIFNFCISGIKNFLNEVKPKNVIFTGGDVDIFFNNLYLKTFDIKVHKFKNLVLFGILLWAYLRHIINKENLISALNSKIFEKSIDFNKIIL